MSPKKGEIKEEGLGEFFTIGKARMPVESADGKYTPKEDVFILDKNNMSFAELILKGAEKNMPVLLTGPTGCGKTATVKWLASKTRNNYRRIQLNGSTNVDSFVGRWLLKHDGTFWVDGILTDAVRNGHWLLLDELNAALPEILFILHELMDSGRLTLDEKDGEVIEAHPNFRLFAAINPWEDYAGTKELNRALIDRFQIILDVDYPSIDHEIKILEAHTGMKDEKTPEGTDSVIRRMVTIASVLRKQHKEQKLVFNCSTRQLINWAKLIPDYGVIESANISVVNKAEEKTDRQVIQDQIKLHFRKSE